MEEAAEYAERSVQARREMARKAAQADAADGGSQSAALERESEQHGEASREHEAEAEESAREADSDS